MTEVIPYGIKAVNYLKDTDTRPFKWIGKALTPRAGADIQAKGFDRYRQLLTGQRLPHLTETYRNIPAGELKDKAMQHIIKENNAVNRTGIGTLLGAYGAYGALSYAAEYALTKALGYGAGKLVKHVADTDPDKDLNSLQITDAFNKRLGLGSTASEISRRLLVDKTDYDKLTLQDLNTALGDTALTAGSIYIYGTHHLGGMLPKLLGAQTFYHGTTPENVKSILKHGLDPAYGGIEGGAADIISRRAIESKEKYTPEQREVFNQYNLAPNEATKREIATDPLFYHTDLKDYNNLQPHYNMFHTGQNIPIDTSKFRDNARGRVYVTPSKLDAMTYAVTNKSNFSEALPTDWSSRLELFQHAVEDPSTLKAYTHPHFHEYIDNTLVKRMDSIGSPNRHIVSRSSDLIKYMIHDMPKMVYKLSSPPVGVSSVVGGALPFNQFHNRFEIDPENIVPTAAYRSKRPNDINDYSKLLKSHPDQVAKIDPKNLSVNKPSISNIWNARSRGSDWFKYVKENPGRFSQGVGMMGLNTLLAAHTIKNDYIPIVQKMLGKYKVKQDTSKNVV